MAEAKSNMGYIVKRYKKRKQPGALGGLFDDILNGITGASSAASTAISATQDPYLPEVLCHITQLQNLDRGQPAGACQATPPGLPGGIGLRRAVVPMRAYVYAEGHKWVYPLAIAGILGLPFLVGYSMGKGK